MWNRMPRLILAQCSSLPVEVVPRFCLLGVTSEFLLFGSDRQLVTGWRA
jgi:hypothetical protein